MDMRAALPTPTGAPAPAGPARPYLSRSGRSRLGRPGGPRVAAALLVALLAGAGALAGCAGDADGAGGAAPTTVTTSFYASAGHTAGSVPPASWLSPAPSAPPTGATPPATATVPEITLSRSGGFAGVYQTLRVAADGSWSWAVGRNGPDDTEPTDRGRLDAQQRAQLARLGADPRLAQEARSGPYTSTCADGFTYLLTAGSATVQWEDCAVKKPEVAAQIAQLLAAATPL